jgi:hypothetical protein
MNKDEIEAELLNSNGPEFEYIRDAKSFSEGMEIAEQFIIDKGIPLNYDEYGDLQVVVDKIQKWEND